MFLEYVHKQKTKRKAGQKSSLTAAFPTLRTMQANMAAFPLITVTFVGVLGSIDGLGVGSGAVVPKG